MCYHKLIHILLHDWGGQYREIFCLRSTILARPKVGTIPRSRTEYFPVLPDPRNCNNGFIIVKNVSQESSLFYCFSNFHNFKQKIQRNLSLSRGIYHYHCLVSVDKQCIFVCFLWLQSYKLSFESHSGTVMPENGQKLEENGMEIVHLIWFNTFITLHSCPLGDILSPFCIF